MDHRLLIVALALLLALAGCTDSPDDPQDDDADGTNDPGDNGAGNQTTAPDPESVSVSTAGNYPVNPGFDPEEITITAGANITLTFSNDDVAAPHGWRVDAIDGASTGAIDAGGSTEISFIALEPGEYDFYCPVGNHRELGQEGTLIVREA